MKKRKLSANTIGFIIAFAGFIASLWIYFVYIQKKADHIIDNPSKENIIVTIDDDTYTIAPEQKVIIHLNQGKHEMSAKNEKDSILLEKTSFEVNKQIGLLNPTQSPYFVFALPYGMEVNGDSIFLANKTNYQGKEYYGDLKIDSTIFLENFYYNLNENFPKITKKSENHKLRTKVFRKDDFKQFYFERFQ